VVAMVESCMTDLTVANEHYRVAFFCRYNPQLYDCICTVSPFLHVTKLLVVNDVKILLLFSSFSGRCWW
jgi:hypothetical protein